MCKKVLIGILGVVAVRSDGLAQDSSRLTASTQLTVELLRWVGDAQPTKLQSKDYLPGEKVEVPSEADGNHLVRFVRPAISPVTLPSKDVTARTWLLPEAVPGGEFVGRLPDVALRPDSYWIAGPSQIHVKRGQARFLSVSGLRPGRYRLWPRYDGGFTGTHAEFEVRAGQSTFLAIPVDRVGAVRITVADEVCLAASGIKLWAVERDPPAATEFASFRQPEGCRWTIRGIRPGAYEAELLLSSGTGGRSRFAVRAGVVTELSIGAAPVQVEGTVALDGASSRNLSLEFVDVAGQSRRRSTVTDRSGTYVVGLDHPGKYRVLLRDGNVPLRTRTVDLATGLNTLNWEIEEGSLTLHVSGHDTGNPITIQIDSPGAVSNEFVSPETPVLRKRGLRFGSYKVSATQGRLTSRVENITLSASTPRAAITLELTEHQSFLSLHDENGRPVRNAKVRPRRGNLVLPRSDLAEQAPGTYSLSGVQPGMQLSISATGFVPTCRTVRVDENLVLTLDGGRAVEVELPADVTMAAMQVVGVENPPYTDCPVPLAEFMPSPGSLSESGRAMYRFQHFPRPYRLMLNRPGLRRQIFVPDSGAVIVEGN